MLLFLDIIFKRAKNILIFNNSKLLASHTRNYVIHFWFPFFLSPFFPQPLSISFRHSSIHSTNIEHLLCSRPYTSCIVSAEWNKQDRSIPWGLQFRWKIDRQQMIIVIRAIKKRSKVRGSELLEVMWRGNLYLSIKWSETASLKSWYFIS